SIVFASDCTFSTCFCGNCFCHFFFFFSSRRRHTRSKRDWSSDVCSSDLIVICDGFVGNIVLKTMEGSVLSLFKKLKEAMMSSTKSKLGALLMKSELKEIKDLLDYTSYEIGRASCRERVNIMVCDG